MQREIYDRENMCPANLKIFTIWYFLRRSLLIPGLFDKTITKRSILQSSTPVTDFSFYSCACVPFPFLLYIILIYVVKGMQLYNGHIFLVKWTFYHDLVTSIFGNTFCLNVYSDYICSCVIFFLETFLYP